MSKNNKNTVDEVKNTQPELPADAHPEFYKDWSLEKMTEKEQEIIKEIEAVETEIKEHTYSLLRSKEAPRQQIGQWIAAFLARYECTWEYTKGMADLIAFWKGDSLEISYSVFDSTIRVLGGLKYSGDDYAKVVAINDYFQSVRELYSADVHRILDLSVRHNAVMQGMENYKRLNNIVEEPGVSTDTRVSE